MSARSGFSASSQHGLTDGEWDSFQTAFTDWYEDSLETMGCYVADVKKILGLPNSHFSQVREFVAPLNETSQRIFIDAQLIACMTVLKASGQYSEWFGMRVEAATEESDRSSGGILDYVFGVTDHNVVTDTSRRIYLEAKRPESISSTLKMEVNRDFLAHEQHFSRPATGHAPSLCELRFAMIRHSPAISIVLNQALKPKPTEVSPSWVRGTKLSPVTTRARSA